MTRQSKVVLRVYEQEFTDERGQVRRYRFRVFGLCKVDRILLEQMVRQHFEGMAELEDIPFAIWQATSVEDWEEFVSKPEEEWTTLQTAGRDYLEDIYMASGGTQLTLRDIHEQAMSFADGYGRGYKQAEDDWGLPKKEGEDPWRGK